jgi:DUF4097 and DUF4098 domain-containing protein YvlB
MRTFRVPLSIFAFLIASLPFTAGCATISEDYRIADGSDQDRGYTSVSGNIDVGRSARIGNAKTVSGNIAIGEQCRVGSLSSVAGRIKVAADSRVGGSIKTVAGDIEIARGCTIAGDVGTVAGRVAVTDSVVKGKVTLTSGKLALTGSRVTGALRVEHSDGEGNDDAEVDIGANSEVGKVIVEKGARVQLRIHNTAKVGTITGAQAEYYD